ncbi:MAG: hypothetical protein ACUVRE_01350 [Thermoanaerobaculaceae bacterium]
MDDLRIRQTREFAPNAISFTTAASAISGIKSSSTAFYFRHFDARIA